MALVIKLINTNVVNTAGNTITIQDTTGLVGSTIDGTGYGAPNPNRGDLVLFMKGYNKTTKGDVAVTFATYTPTSALTYTANVGKDGWYRFNLLSIPLLNILLLNDYEAGQVVYDASIAKLVVVVDTLIPNTVFYNRTLELIDLSKVVDSLYTVATIDSFFIANNSKTKLRVNTAITALLIREVSFSDKHLIRLKDNYNAIRAVLQGAIYEYSRGNKFVAQASIEFLNTNNYEIY